MQGHNYPTTEQGLFFWLHCPTERGHSYDLDHVFNIIAALEELATLMIETQGVKYHNSLDLTGFIDGSANPNGEHKYLESLIPDGQ